MVAPTDREKWEAEIRYRYLRNIASLLAPGGQFVVAAPPNCSFCKVGDLQFPSPAIDEHDLQRAFSMLNFDMSSVVLQVCNVPEQIHSGFESIALASGRIR